MAYAYWMDELGDGKLVSPLLRSPYRKSVSGANHQSMDGECSHCGVECRMYTMVQLKALDQD